MTWADRDVLEARVRSLDSETLAAFVADLWTARGFETDRDNAAVIARRGGETQVVYVLTGRVTTPSGETARPVDVVVAAGRPRAGEALAAESDAQVVDAAGLVEMLQYAVARDVAADLCERHFGAAPGALTFPPRDRVSRAVTGLQIETVVTVVLALFVVAVGAGAVFGLAGPGANDNGPSDEAAGTPETVTNPADAEPTTVTVEAGASPTETGGDPAAVPGVSETGIRNASRLGQAHAGTVASTSSYTIWFDYYTAENGSVGQVKRDVNVRVDAEKIAVQTIREGIGGTRSPVRISYFDGTDRYVAANVTDDFTRVDNRTPTATPLVVPFTRPSEMVRVYLATPESAVSVAEHTASDQRYRLQGTGRPAGLPDAVTDYEMTAVVDQRGFVRTFDAEFSVVCDTDDDGVTERKRVRLTWTYGRINSTEIGLHPR